VRFFIENYPSWGEEAADDGDDSDDSDDDADAPDQSVKITRSWSAVDEDCIVYRAYVRTGGPHTLCANIMFTQTTEVVLEFSKFNYDDGVPQRAPCVLLFEAFDGAPKVVCMDTAVGLVHCHSTDYKYNLRMDLSDLKVALENPREVPETKAILDRLQAAAAEREEEAGDVPGTYTRAVDDAKKRLDNLGDDVRVIGHFDGNSINYLGLLTSAEYAALQALVKGIELITPDGPAPTQSVTIEI